MSRRVPPETVGTALVAAGCPDRRVAVCARLAEPGEEVAHTDLAGLAAGHVRPAGGRHPAGPEDADDGGRAPDPGEPVPDGR